jgi:hypothetical protein
VAEPRVISPDDPRIQEKLAERADARLDRFADSMRRLAPGEMGKLRRDAIRDPRVTVEDLKRDFTDAAHVDLARELANAAAANTKPRSRLAWEPGDGDE